MFAVGLDDMLSTVRTANDVPAILWLHEYVVRPRPLYVVDHLTDGASLA
jgi:hypothetical protein